jgi:hypothetical protein
MLVFLFINFGISQQIDNKVGTSGFQFLKIGIGSRDAALAGASFSVSEGPAAMYWNPAGICSDDKFSLSFFYNSWIATIEHSFIGFTTPVSANSYVGFSLNYLTMDEMEETTINEPFGTGRKFTAGDYAASLSYGRRVTDRFSTALTIKYISEKIWDLEANGWAFDVGFIYKYNRITIGMSFTNFGNDKEISGSQLELEQQIFPDYQSDEVLLSLDPQKIRLPSVFRVGAGYEIFNQNIHKVLVLGNLAYYNDIGEKSNVGIEYAFFDNYMLRGGYQFKRDGFNWSFGGGIKVYVGNTELIIDYAAINTDDFDVRHQTGLTFKL